MEALISITGVAGGISRDMQRPLVEGALNTPVAFLILIFIHLINVVFEVHLKKNWNIIKELDICCHSFLTFFFIYFF